MESLVASASLSHTQMRDAVLAMERRLNDESAARNNGFGELVFALERERRERLAWQAKEAQAKEAKEAQEAELLAHAEAEGGGGAESNAVSNAGEAERSSGGGVENLIQKVEAHAQEVAFASHARNAQATQLVAMEARLETVIHQHAQHVDTMERQMHRMVKQIEILQEGLQVSQHRGTCVV